MLHCQSVLAISGVWGATSVAKAAILPELYLSRQNRSAAMEASEAKAHKSEKRPNNSSFVIERLLPSTALPAASYIQRRYAGEPDAPHFRARPVYLIESCTLIRAPSLFLSDLTAPRSFVNRDVSAALFRSAAVCDQRHDRHCGTGRCT